MTKTFLHNAYCPVPHGQVWYRNLRPSEVNIIICGGLCASSRHVGRHSPTLGLPSRVLTLFRSGVFAPSWLVLHPITMG